MYSGDIKCCRRCGSFNITMNVNSSEVVCNDCKNKTKPKTITQSSFYI